MDIRCKTKENQSIVHDSRETRSPEKVGIGEKREGRSERRWGKRQGGGEHDGKILRFPIQI